MKTIFSKQFLIISALIITSCNHKSNNTGVHYSTTEDSVFIANAKAVQVQLVDTLNYQEIVIERQGNGIINGVIVPKFHGIINISCDYAAQELQVISERIVHNHSEISNESIIMMEFFRSGDSPDGLNYGLVKRINGIWESNLNSVYLNVKVFEKEVEEAKNNATKTWQERSKELASGGRILGVYTYVDTTYIMLYKKAGKYYLHEFDVCSSKNNKDELVRIGNNRFRYKNGDYEDIFAIKGKSLITYMPDPFNPSQLFEADEWISLN